MKSEFCAEKSLVEEIDKEIWDELTIRSQLESFITDDTEFFLEILSDEFDEEFDYYGGKTIQYEETLKVNLLEKTEQFIDFVISKKEMTKDQALTLILDVVKTYLINGKRMCN